MRFLTLIVITQDLNLKLTTLQEQAKIVEDDKRKDCEQRIKVRESVFARDRSPNLVLVCCFSPPAKCFLRVLWFFPLVQNQQVLSHLISCGL